MNWNTWYSSLDNQFVKLQRMRHGTGIITRTRPKRLTINEFLSMGKRLEKCASIYTTIRI